MKLSGYFGNFYWLSFHCLWTEGLEHWRWPSAVMRRKAASFLVRFWKCWLCYDTLKTDLIICLFMDNVPFLWEAIQSLCDYGLINPGLRIDLPIGKLRSYSFLCWFGPIYPSLLVCSVYCFFNLFKKVQWCSCFGLQMHCCYCCKRRAP